MKKHSAPIDTYLIWDCGTCKSNKVGFIRQISETLKLKISKIMIFLEALTDLPQEISVLSKIIPTIIRFGKNCIFDVIVDTIKLTKNQKNHFNVILVSNQLSIWISLFNRIEPSQIVFFTSSNPESSFEYSFLPKNIQTIKYQWPNLTLSENELTSQETNVLSEETDDVQDMSNLNDEELIHNLQNDFPLLESSMHINDNEEEDTDILDQEGNIHKQITLNDKDFSTQSKESIEIQNEEEDQINIKDIPEEEDFRDELSSEIEYGKFESNAEEYLKEEDSLKKANKKPTTLSQKNIVENYSTSNEEPIFSIAIKFKPLIESIKNAGKSIISLSDLESYLKSYCEKEKIKISNTMSLINKASETGIIIYDKSINYLRFRNRQMMIGTIKYV